MNSYKNNWVNAGVTRYLVLFLSDYRLMTFQMMLSLILLYMLMILLKVALSVIRPLIWGTTRDMKWLVDFMLEKFKLFHLTRRTSQVLLM